MKNPDLVVAFDVDDTLVMWHEPFEHDDIYISEFQNPVWLKPHKQHIAELKILSTTHKIIVWSQEGEDWAKKICDKLGLTQYVDIFMTKPYVYYDDIPAHEWMTRKYIGEG